jgi:microcystin-dependent protein
MPGTLNLALAQQLNINGQPLAGALLYFFQVGTVSTLQNSYQDFGLTIPNANPLVADQYGRIPMFYLADGQVHVRLTDANGTVIFDYPSMQVVGPSSGGGGGGGGGTVDPSTVAATGDVKYRLTTEIITGWVKLNAQTIGAPSSGATQRANADTQNLFVYLWNNFSNAHAPVSGGRGASALADYSANKTIGLPDLRGRVMVGLDDMGSTAAGIILPKNVTSGGGDGPTTPAASGGEANHTLLLAEAPTGQLTLNDPTHSHNTAFGGNSGQGGAFSGTISNSIISATTQAALTGITLTDNAGGGSHNTMQPFVLVTVYMHL